MKTSRICKQNPYMVGTFAAAAAFLLAFQAAAETIHYEGVPADSKCKMAGTSTLLGGIPGHDWTMQSSMVLGSMDVEASFPESALTNSAAAKPVSQVGIPVRSFKSGTAAMDTKMQGHMQIAKFPKIVYRLIELKPTSQPGATGPLKFDALGELTITGVTVTNTMPVTIEKKEGKLHVIGSTPIKMTDYGLKPYTFLSLTTGDELTITYDWVLAPKAN